MGDEQILAQSRGLLCRLQDHVRDFAVAARNSAAEGELAAVAAVTAADTLYRIDKITDDAILAWLEAHWPAEMPVEIVMEGIEEDQPLTFPAGTPAERTQWKCIIDPVDGTRSLMYDKRSAWVLTALAPQRGCETSLADVQVAAMTEIPTSKQWRADQLSAVRGCGSGGIVAESLDVLDGSRQPLRLRPSQANDFRHGFASIAHFFPAGKALLAQLETEIWEELYGHESSGSPLVFDDQWISTGGQIYELAVGHDRMLGDLRPLAYGKLGLDSHLTCHPYDICTSMILTEAGGIVETPWGRPLDVPLDTTSPVSWMGYANEQLAAQVRPILARLLKKHFGDPA